MKKTNVVDLNSIDLTDLSKVDSENDYKTDGKWL